MTIIALCRLDPVVRRLVPRPMMVGAVAVSLLAVTGPALAVGLSEALALAERNDPQYQEEFHGREAVDERYVQARAALLPQVTLTAERIERQQDIVSSDNEEYASGSTSFPTTTYGASIEQSIYDYSRWAELDKAKLEIQQASAELEVARQDLFLRVARRYFDALSLYENLHFVRAEKSSVEANFEMVQARHEDGLAREVDLLDAEARLQQVVARELEVENELRDALEGLAEVTGERPATLRPVNESLELSRPDPDSAEAWLELAVERSPRLEAATLGTDVAGQEVKVRRGGHYPTLDLMISYDSEETEGSLFGGGSEVETQDIAVSLSVPIYRGGMTSSRVREGESRISAAQSRLEGVVRNIDRRVQGGYQGILTAMARERSLTESLEASERVVESREVGVESGVIPVLDLLDAERDLFFARSELASARYDYLLSVLELKHAAGVLAPEEFERIDALLGEETDVLAMGQR
ncbi:MAG: TolC family outer membrane protein [Pseudomonadota bacterium]